MSSLNDKHYLIIENTSNHLDKTCHVIDIDGKLSGGWYVQIGMISGFDSRIKKRFHWHCIRRHHNIKQGRFSLVYESDLKVTLRMETRINRILNETARVKYKLKFHKSIYSFFDSIGWDYKNKKVSYTDEMLMLYKDAV